MNALLWNRTAYDVATLAGALMTLQKQHSRVEHTRDDALITTYVGMALGIVERRANINLTMATFESVGELGRALNAPCVCPNGSWGHLLPFNNVREARVFDAVAVDVSAGWEVVQQQFGGNADAYLWSDAQAPLPTGGSVEVDVGMDDVALMDPAVLAVVLRVGASLYEYREANLALSEEAFAAELMQIWRPCA